MAISIVLAVSAFWLSGCYKAQYRALQSHVMCVYEQTQLPLQMLQNPEQCAGAGCSEAARNLNDARESLREQAHCHPCVQGGTP